MYGGNATGEESIACQAKPANFKLREQLVMRLDTAKKQVAALENALKLLDSQPGFEGLLDALTEANIHRF